MPASAAPLRICVVIETPLMRWGGLCALIQSGKQAIEASLFALGTWGLLKRHVEQSPKS